MRFLRELRKLQQQYIDSGDAYSANTRSIPARLLDVTIRTWHLGFTSFGGPPVHFLTFRRKFVDGSDGHPPWVDGQTFQELMSLCQSTPGPGSTKTLVCLAWIHAGPLAALWVFLLWSLPSALGMLALGLGIQQVGEVLPSIAFAFLTGINAAIVGVIALAATQLSASSIRSQLDRILIVSGACAGLCYSSIWYFPLIIVSGGIITITWIYACLPLVTRARVKWEAHRELRAAAQKEIAEADDESAPGQSRTQPRSMEVPDSTQHKAARISTGDAATAPVALVASAEPLDPRVDTQSYRIPVPVGLLLIAFAVALVVVLSVTSRTIPSPQRPHEFVANMLLAGSIIFGGGPVLIPLMRDYVVEPGWVSPRDFLIGLAIIQAFPGPNFNFAVYLGVLSMLGTGYSPILGAFLGVLGIFAPGLMIGIGTMSVWNAIRKRAFIMNLLRGVNCTAIGLIFTAVYRIWQIGYLSQDAPSGEPLGNEPWWVVVTVVSYASNRWLKVPAAGAILIGGVLGLCWFGAVGSRRP